ALVPPDRAVDPQLGKERVSGVGDRAVKTHVVGKTYRARMIDRSAKSELFQPLVLAVAERIETQPSYEIRLIGDVIGDAAPAVKRSRPPLDSAFGNVSVESDAGTTIRGYRRGVQQRLQTTFYKVQVS